MPSYRRLEAPGATLFFTVVTHERRRILTSPQSLEILRAAFRQEMDHHPFVIDAIVIFPDHLHTIWTLPPGDTRFSMRWSKIKGEFTERFLAVGGAEGTRGASRLKRGERGVWQRRFWDRVVRDDDELDAFMNYIHWNPVKHGVASCPHSWPQSSFTKWVRAGRYSADWMCRCDRSIPAKPRFERLRGLLGEIE